MLALLVALLLTSPATIAGTSSTAPQPRGTSFTITGDCDGSNSVTVDEIITGINIALGLRPLADCGVFDSNGDGSVTVDELLQAVNVALHGPPPTPTQTAPPTPTASPGPGFPFDLGARELAVRRDGTFVQSQFRSSAVDGFDISVDPWLPATFRLQAGSLDENGVAELRLLDDVILGFPLLDGSVACFRFAADGSSGELACRSGRGKALRVVGRAGETEIIAEIDPVSSAGSAYLELMTSFVKLPINSAPVDCVAATFGELEPAAWTSGRAVAEVVGPLPFGESMSVEADGLRCDRATPDFTCGGEPFDCSQWTDPNGPGMIIYPVLGLDQNGLGGDGAANLLVIHGQGPN